MSKTNSDPTIIHGGLATYTDWSGETVTIERNGNKYGPEQAISIGETEHGGDYSISDAIQTLRHIDAPDEIIDFVLTDHNL